MITLRKRALVTSLAVVGLTLTSFQGVDAAIDTKKTGIQIFDEEKCDNEMNVKATTRGTGSNITKTKVFYTLKRDGEFIDNFSRTKNDDYVTLTMNHSGNDDSREAGGPKWAVKAEHRVDYNNGDTDRAKSSDKAFGKCGSSKRISSNSIAPKVLDDVEIKLERKWKEVMEAHGIDENEWTRYTFDDFVNVQVSSRDKNYTSAQKVFLLDDAIIENVNHQRGDSEGLYLVDKAEEKGLYIYQKANGENVVVEFSMKDKNDVKGLSADGDDNIWRLVDTKVK